MLTLLPTYAVPKTMTLTEMQEENYKDPTLSLLKILIQKNSWHTVDNFNNPFVNRDEVRWFYKDQRRNQSCQQRLFNYSWIKIDIIPNLTQGSHRTCSRRSLGYCQNKATS